MRILLIGPDDPGGSLTPYIDGLAEGLRARGCRVDRAGTPGVPWDPERRAFRPWEEVREAAAGLLRGVELAAYDVISAHFGKLEVEQLLPVLWAGTPRAPAVYHVHSLAWDLFDEFVPAPGMPERVAAAAWSMEGFVFFGRYALERRRAQVGGRPFTVSFYPHSAAVPRPGARAGWKRGRPLASMAGFASPWKDVESLLAAFREVQTPLDFVLAGPFWESRLGFRAAEIGAVRVTVVDEYLDGDASAALIGESDFGIFPYVEHRTFQGSGSLASYLHFGVPVVAFGTANLPEQVEDAGVIVAPDDRAGLVRALEAMAADGEARRAAAAAARARAHLFDPQRHADECLALFREVVRRHQAP